MPWYDVFSNWGRNVVKLFSCEKSPERMYKRGYRRYADDVEHGPQQDSTATIFTEHTSNTAIRNSSENTSKYSDNALQKDRTYENKVKNRKDKNRKDKNRKKVNSHVGGNQMRTSDQDCIPDELISSINNMALTLSNTEDQIPGPSHRNNMDEDCRRSAPRDDDIQSYRPPQNWLLSREEASSQRRVYDNKKHGQSKPNFSDIDLNALETGCNSSNIDVIVCRPSQNWVNTIEENRSEDTNVYDSEFHSRHLKTNVTNATNEKSASNVPSCSQHNYEKPPSRKVETSRHRQVTQSNTERQMTVGKPEEYRSQTTKAITKGGYSECYQGKGKTYSSQLSKKFEAGMTSATSSTSVQKRDTQDHALKPKRAKNTKEPSQMENQVIPYDSQRRQVENTSNIQSADCPDRNPESTPRRQRRNCLIQRVIPTTSNTHLIGITNTNPIEEGNQACVRSSLKRKSDEQGNKSKKRKKTPPIEIITVEILNNFELNLHDTDLTAYEKNYLGRIYDILKKCKEFETKVDLIEEELDEQKMYYFEENLQRNMEKLDRIDPQESTVLGQQKTNVIKYIYKIIEKLEEKSRLE